MSLSGKVAIVTGGNSGIGKSVVLALAAQGANIVIDYVADEVATEALEQQVVALGSQALGIDADVSKVADIQRLIAETVARFGRLDIMVNMSSVHEDWPIPGNTAYCLSKGGMRMLAMGHRSRSI